MADDTAAPTTPAQPVDISHGLQQRDDTTPSPGELQVEGQTAATNAPAPLQNATRGIGVQYTKPSGDSESAIDPGSNYKVVATVKHNDPRNIEIDDQATLDQHADQVIPHELYHIWANNLPASLKAKIPESSSIKDYGDPSVESVNAMRAKGMKLLDVPNEKAAEMMRWASKYRSDPKVQAAMKPWLDDMRKTPLSVVEGTAPSDKQINTHPRAPMGPSDDIPGMEALSGKVDLTHGLQPHSTAASKTDQPDQYMAVKNPKGLVERGNLPIWNRPTVKNADGTHSSEYSTSFQDDKGKEVLVPTVVNGKFLTPDGKKPPEGSAAEKTMFKAAWQHYEKTGEHLGKFDNPDNANAYAGKLHNRGTRK